MATKNGVEFAPIEGYVAIPNWSEIPREKKMQAYAAGSVFMDRVRDGERMVFIREDFVDALGLRPLIVDG